MTNAVRPNQPDMEPNLCPVLAVCLLAPSSSEHFHTKHWVSGPAFGQKTRSPLPPKLPFCSRGQGCFAAAARPLHRSMSSARLNCGLVWWLVWDSPALWCAPAWLKCLSAVFAWTSPRQQALHMHYPISISSGAAFAKCRFVCVSSTNIVPD